MIGFVFNSSNEIYHTSQGNIGYGVTIFQWPYDELVALEEMVSKYSLKLNKNTVPRCVEFMEVSDWEKKANKKGRVLSDEHRQIHTKLLNDFESKWKKDYSQYPVVKFVKQ
jgi:hypothetical protein